MLVCDSSYMHHEARLYVSRRLFHVGMGGEESEPKLRQHAAGRCRAVPCPSFYKDLKYLKFQVEDYRPRVMRFAVAQGETGRLLSAFARTM